MAFYVYILKCADNSYYTGHTDNLDVRLASHQSGEVDGYTATRLPVELAFCETFVSRVEALEMERRIKGWSRAKKEALMRGDWNEVSRLARNALKRAEDQAVHGSTGSPRTDIERTVAADAAKIPTTVRPELVEGRESRQTDEN